MWNNIPSLFGINGDATKTHVLETTESRKRMVERRSYYWTKILTEISVLSVCGLGLMFMVDRMARSLTDREHNEKETENIRQHIANKLKRNGKLPKMNHYENIILQDITFPDQISTTFKSIGGLEKLKQEIYEMVILPLMNPDLFSSISTDGSKSKLVTHPKGVLLYGPPGTGKTMMAKAIAKDCGATFINVRLSTLQNKWFGESNKLVGALFSVAKKLQPTIIFIDEMDFVLGKRTGSDHEITGGMKAQFMSLWDGLTSDDNTQFIVLGATNQPFNIDKAILRRLPRQFLFELPNKKERAKIIDVILENNRLDPDFDIELIAEQTEGYCGSDLKELCKYAAMIPIREVIKTCRKSKMERITDLPSDIKPRSLTTQDCLNALSKIEPTGAASYQYQKTFNAQTNAQTKNPNQEKQPLQVGEVHTFLEFLQNLCLAWQLQKHSITGYKTPAITTTNITTSTITSTSTSISTSTSASNSNSNSTSP